MIMSRRMAAERNAADLARAARERPLRFAPGRAAEKRPWLMRVRRVHDRLRSVAGRRG